MSSALLGPSPMPFLRKERQKAWPASWEHKGSSFGTFGYLPHSDLVLWDQERAKEPERNWPAHGAVCRLYDPKRVNKAAWKPTTWQHHGPSFPGGFPSKEPPKALRKLERTRRASVAMASTAAMSTSSLTPSVTRSVSQSVSRLTRSSASPRAASKSESVPSQVPSAKSDFKSDFKSVRRKSEHSEPWTIVGEILPD